MSRIIKLVALALIAVPSSASAADRKEPRSLPDEAAYLAEKSRSSGWQSGEVTVTMDEGKKKSTGKLSLRFETEKDKPAGSVVLVFTHRVLLGGSQVASNAKFELTEKDGKRSIKLIQGKNTSTLEYTIEAGELKLKGDMVPWAGWDADLSKGVTFQPGK
jgi:hypothetical protein